MEIDDFLDQVTDATPAIVTKQKVNADNQSIESHVTSINEYLKHKDFFAAFESFLQLKQESAQVSVDTLATQDSLQKAVQESYSLLIDSLKTMEKSSQKTVQEIMHLIQLVKEELGHNHMESAIALYDEIRNRYELIPEPFSHIKSGIFHHIVLTYSEIKKYVDQKEQQELQYITSQCKSLSQQIYTHLQQQQTQQAKSKYAQLESVLHSIPLKHIAVRVQLMNAAVLLKNQITLQESTKQISSMKSIDTEFYKALQGVTIAQEEETKKQEQVKQAPPTLPDFSASIEDLKKQAQAIQKTLHQSK